MAVTWKTLLRWNTGYSADSVEWCPLVPYQDVLVCGTYQLDKKDEDQGENNKKQTRLGRIYLFVIDENSKELCPVQTIDTAGVLDQKWCYHLVQDFPVLVAVTSEGYIQLYRLRSADGSLKLELWQEVLIGESVLALSLDWSSNKSGSAEPMLVVSDSAGAVRVLKVAETGLREIFARQAHGFEAWVASFNYWNTDVFYSGGDDCLFKGYDRRAPDAVITNKSHEAGVTAIRGDVESEHRILTGSYDEKVRLWDARSLKSCISETEVGGGVWRLKWHPRAKGVVLAACMYGGFRLLRLEGDGGMRSEGAGGRQLHAVCEYRQHESIAYGADWNHRNGLVATCSFYDCRMHIGEILLE
ncbi:unnamed protein product, partial [Iphiclides podalirius]